MVLPTMNFKYLPVKPRTAFGLIFHQFFYLYTSRSKSPDWKLVNATVIITIYDMVIITDFHSH